MSRELVVVLIFVVLLGVGTLFFENSRLTSKHIAIIAVLAALASLGRVPFAGFPNVQPTTFIVIISGAVFGCTVGWSVGVTAALVSNIFLGHGPWTFFQMFAWGLCGVSAGLFARVVRPDRKIIWSAFSAAWGILFGVIMNLWYWISFVYPLSFKGWLGVQAASLWFDLMHAGANALLYVFLGVSVVKILGRFKSKMSPKTIEIRYTIPEGA